MMLEKNIHYLRDEMGLTQPELAALMGVTHVTVSNWEGGRRTPSLNDIIRLADIFNVDLDTLVGRSKKELVDNICAMRLLEKYSALDNFGKRAVDCVCDIEYERTLSVATKNKVMEFPGRLIRLYAFPAAAGFAAPIEGEDFELIPLNESAPKNADYAVRISGDSMEPGIRNGDIVYIKETSELDNGDIGIFAVNGEMYCKRYFKDENNNLHLLSDNPSRADASVHINSDSDTTIKCCGRVIQS